MRRLFVLVAGLGLLHSAAGCYHIAGKCDCMPPIQPCCMYGLYPAGYAGPAVGPHAVETPAPEAVPVQPRATQGPSGAEPLTKEPIGLPKEL